MFLCDSQVKIMARDDLFRLRPPLSRRVVISGPLFDVRKLNIGRHEVCLLRDDRLKARLADDMAKPAISQIVTSLSYRISLTQRNGFGISASARRSS
jgi:hypothetical protein